MDKPVTRRELLEVLDLWGNAFEARVVTKLDATLHQLRIELSVEFAQHSDRVLEETKKIVAVVDEKYRGLPVKVDACEAKLDELASHKLPERVAALEANAPPPKRQRRR
jgi:hypothetical protein